MLDVYYAGGPKGDGTSWYAIPKPSRMREKAWVNLQLKLVEKAREMLGTNLIRASGWAEGHLALLVPLGFAKRKQWRAFESWLRSSRR